MEILWENYMQNGKINPVSGIFLGKNNFGYQDKTEYVVTPNVQNDSDYNKEDIMARYLPDSSDSSNSWATFDFPDFLDFRTTISPTLMRLCQLLRLSTFVRLSKKRDFRDFFDFPDFCAPSADGVTSRPRRWVGVGSPGPSLCPKKEPSAGSFFVFHFYK